MLDKIRTHPILANYLANQCFENNISVSFDSTINPNEYVILKVDDYYNGLGLQYTPPAPDCLIVLECKNAGHSLIIVELKGISKSKGFELNNMIKKFNTCLDDFISNRFQELLFMDYKRIRLFFVSEIDVYKRDLGLKMEILINHRFKYNGKNYLIRPFLPVPTIKNCY